MEDLPPGEAASPETVGAALLDAADKAVRTALEHTTDVSIPWRVLSIVAGITPRSAREKADEIVTALVDGPGRPLRLRAPAGRAVTGPVLWARDGYGSRFAVAAPFRASDGQDRWYLWDTDACGHQAFTVHSGFYATAEQALAAWRDGVGETAAGKAELTPIDDPALAADILYREDGILRFGGENEPQLAEYLRGRRLAEEVVTALGDFRTKRPELDADRAARQFTAWMRQHRTPPAGPLHELATELASSWSLDAPAALYGTCSAHRVALTVPHVRDYYEDDFADEVLAMLPDWITWLAERNGTPPELVERSRAYVLGEAYPGLLDADGRPDYLARVAE